MIIGVFVTALIARHFGPEGFGQYNYVIAFVTLFTALSTLGLETLTVKSLIEKKYDEGTILGTSLILRFLGGILLTIFSGIVIRILEPENNYIHVLVLIVSFSMVIKSLEVIEYWIQAHQNAKISSLIRMCAYLISAGMKILLVVMDGGVFHYTLIYTVDSLIVGLGLLMAYRKYRIYKSKWSVSIDYSKEILSQSWPLILSGLMITLYMKIDQVMLGIMMNSKSEVGVYSAATQVASMWYFVPMAIIVSFKPVIMKKKTENEASYLSTIQLLYTIIIWISICFGTIIIFSSNFIINILFGSEYLEAANILSISVWAGTFAMIGTASSIWLVCESLHKYNLVFVFSGAIANVILNLIMIPILGGYGAAIATLSSQILTNVVTPIFFKKIRVNMILIYKAFTLSILKNLFIKK